MSLPTKLAFVDVETSGCRWSDRIIEIGILRIEDGQLVRTFQTLLNPETYVPEEILEMTGINPAQLENAPSFYSVKDDIAEILEDCVFVAHNVRFDYSFIKNEFKRLDETFSSKHFCTVKLSRALFPDQRHHNLDALIDRHGFKIKSRHRAFDDAQILWDFYQLVLKSFNEEQIEIALKKAMKRPSLPIKITEEQLDLLPEAPGVYIFYGESGTPLYVGKSINIRDRVLSHFSSDHLSSTEMKISQQIESIETIVTAGELSALLKESELVKKMQPLYNRQLRQKRLMTVLKSKFDGLYQSIDTATADLIDATKLDEILGLFRGVKNAKDFLTYLCKEFELCEKLLGLEKTSSACFGYRLGRCKGACVKKEDPVKYNFRFINAFSKSKLKPWPFNGPIMIKEKNDDEGIEEGFLLDKWCYLGKAKINAELRINNAEGEDNLSFDLDTYKILSRYLLSKKNQKKIKLIKNQQKNTIDQDVDFSLGV